MSHATFPYRLAAIDLDDTLLGEDKKVSAANLNAIRQLQALGVQIVLASGRRHGNMARFHQQLGLTGYIISGQGAVVKHAETGETVYRAEVGAALSQEIIAEGLGQGCAVLAYQEDGVFGEGPEGFLGVYEKLADDRLERVELAGMRGKAMEKVFWIGKPEAIEKMMPGARERYGGRADTVITEPDFLEFTAHGVNKASALAALAHRLGIERKAVLAFGDGNNDVAMLRWAGLGVAMYHGKAGAHAAADVVTGAGDAETSFARGVAEVFRRAGAGKQTV